MGRTYVPICQLLLEIVVAHESDTGLDGVPDDERCTARVQPCDAFVSEGVAQDRDRALFL